MLQNGSDTDRLVTITMLALGLFSKTPGGSLRLTTSMSYARSHYTRSLDSRAAWAEVLVLTACSSFPASWRATVLNLTS
jgi:hypothetical protein